MQSQFYMYCLPWDLEDEGLEESIGRLAGEIGVDGINVAATTSEVVHYRPRCNDMDRVFQTDAAAHFQPDSKRYSSVKIKPITASWMKSRNPLERIAKAAEREKLQVRVSVDCCTGRRMVARYPFATCTNALGVSDDFHLCPSNPEVGEYLRLIVDDLSANYPLTGIELRRLGLSARVRWEDITWVGPPLSPLALMLLELCFCPSCRQLARDVGINADQVHVQVRDLLIQWLEDPSFRDLKREQLVANGTELQKYRFHQFWSRLVLVGNLRKSLPESVSISVKFDGIPYTRQLVRQCLDESCFVVVPRDLADQRMGANSAYELAGIAADKLDWLTPFDAFDYPGAASLVSDVREAANRGYRTIGFDNYGTIQTPCFDWIRQAIRFARREAR